MPAKPDARGSALHYVSNLTDKQFTEFFYEAVRNRRILRSGHFVLGEVEHDEDGWVLDLVAQDDREAYGDSWADDVPLCQQGQCAACGHSVLSWAKSAICPVCRSKVRCT